MSAPTAVCSTPMRQPGQIGDAAARHQHVGAVRDIEHQHGDQIEPGVQRTDHLVERQCGALDQVGAEGAQHVGGGRHLDQADATLVVAAECACQIERLVTRPDVAGDAQHRLGCAAAAQPGRSQRRAGSRQPGTPRPAWAADRWACGGGDEGHGARS